MQNAECKMPSEELNAAGSSPPEPSTTQARPARRNRLLWTLSQRRALLALCMLVLGFLSVESWRKPVTLGDPPSQISIRADEIQDRLDPNSATADEMAAI